MAVGFFDSSSDPSNPDSYDAIQRKRKLAEALMAQGNATTPIQSWTQGLARLAQAGVGAYKERQADDAEKQSSKSFTDTLMSALGGAPVTGTQTPAPEPTAPQPGGVAPSVGPVATGSSPNKEAFITQMMPHAIEVSKQTGVDPRIVVAQAGLESGWGAKAPGNNFFGIKSHGLPGGQTLNTTENVGGQNVATSDSFRQYGGMGQSAQGYAEFLKSNPRYQPMLQAQGLDAQVAALGKSGYATDPQYGDKIGAIARSLQAPGQNAQVAGNGPMAYAPQQGADPRAALAPALGGAPSPAVAPSATPAAPDQSRALLAMALNPSLSPSQRQQAMAVATMMQGQNKATYQTLADGTIIQLDPNGKLPPKPVYQAPTKSTYSVVGEDEFGNKKYGWVDPVTKTITPGPSAAPAQGAAPADAGGSQIPPAPPGVDPKLWRAEQTKRLANGDKLTEVQTNANAFVTRMEDAEKVLSSVESKGLSPRNILADKTPMVGNLIRDEGGQQYDQAKRAFVNSVLRKESGAAIGKDEFANAEKQYFPQPGDSASVIKQKREARKTAIDGMRTAAGPAYKARDPKADLKSKYGLE